MGAMPGPLALCRLHTTLPGCGTLVPGACVFTLILKSGVLFLALVLPWPSRLVA